MEKRSNINRRQFIQTTVGAGIVVAGMPLLNSCSSYDSKGLPTTVLGKTGVRIPKMAVGLGSRFCNIDSVDEAIEMLNFALDNGLYYWDTANIYVNKKNGAISEERIGKVIAYRRDEVFLSTKVTERDPDAAKRQIESSLKRLQTDKLDMLKIHDIRSMEDANSISQKGQLIELVHKMKEEGVCRFVGFSGHTSAEAMKAMADRGDFDSMLLAINHWGIKHNPQQRQELAIPAALDKGMGIMLMKAVRPKEKIENINVTDLIRYSLSIEGPHGLVLGMDSKEIVQSNLEILRNFKPMAEEEMDKMALALNTFLNDRNMEWKQHGYCDGNWV